MMMNTEMLHRLDTPENVTGFGRMSVLERQQARVRWQELQPAQVQQMGFGYFNASDQLSNMFSAPAPAPAPAQDFHGGLMINDQSFGGLLLNPSMEPDPCVQSSSSNHFENVGGGNFGMLGGCELGNVAGFGLNYGVSRTASCPPAVAAALAEAASAATKRKETPLPEKLALSAGRESFKKRKADKNQSQKVAIEGQSKDKKGKGCVEEEESRVTEERSKDTNNNNNNKTEPSETSKENSKVSEVQKPDYIHVRARRGQATDSHSLAERVRREKISERMKYLQDLVPGCNKITGKAGMLDEIINYVQSLQRQVEFLSMKLATVNPRLDLEIENLFSKEVFPVSTSGTAHVIDVSSEMNNPPNYNFASLEQVVSCCGMETEKNLPDMALRRTISAPVSLPETMIDSHYLNQIHPYAVWDAELQSLYPLEFQQGRSSAALLSQPCSGFDGGNNVKIEM